MREHVQGYIYYPDAVPALAKLSLGCGSAYAQPYPVLWPPAEA